MVPYLPKAASTIMDRKLQSLANRRVPGIRSSGANYIVLAKKSDLPNV